MIFFEYLSNLFSQVQGVLFEFLVQRVLFALGMNHLSELAFDATEWFLVGMLEVSVLALVLGGLEHWFPLERQLDKRSRRLDRLYTLLHRLGLFPLLAFALLTPLFDGLEGQLRFLGISRLNLEQVLGRLLDSPAWQSFFERPVVALLLYLVILDFADYWIHRAQHWFEPWWQLHALHHSQREMNFWSDQRNHLLDDLLRDALMAMLALFLGASPSQFLALTVLSRVVQSLQHANLRLRFGAFGERLLVSPSFHRLHHGIGVGHEGTHKGCNFAVLFPLWDVIFKSADFRPGFVPTGVRDQLEGRAYGDQFWTQQGLALRRMAQSVKTMLMSTKKGPKNAS